MPPGRLAILVPGLFQVCAPFFCIECELITLLHFLPTSGASSSRAGNFLSPGRSLNFQCSGPVVSNLHFSVHFKNDFYGIFFRDRCAKITKNTAISRFISLNTHRAGIQLRIICVAIPLRGFAKSGRQSSCRLGF